MNAEECNERAFHCVANAAQARDETVSQEFLKLAAYWRAMAVRNIFLGHFTDPADRQNGGRHFMLPDS
jgi:hypothetical protein